MGDIHFCYAHDLRTPSTRELLQREHPVDEHLVDHNRQDMPEEYW